MLILSGLPSQAPVLGNACGVAQDQTGAAIAGGIVELSSTSVRLKSSTDTTGQFCFKDIEPGLYQLTLQADGFKTDHRQMKVDAGESVRVKVSMVISSVGQEVTVTVAEGSADPGSLNVAQTQITSGLILNLPSESVNAAMSSILTLATPGVAADSNGVFHPLGEHAETSFSLDGQPISDQQSRIFSNQISVNTIQEMRTIQGAPPPNSATRLA